ncbi:hypothetical protein BZG36_02914 [Bifiguratus adelaidae]|uniref:Guanine nucleotide-binding protein subunit gamma n=1 Tax=Bifiguratus adelaidae TaxID=1938954 RepID=A0A261Y1E0_9FUNG|nr:hypothetical protein BZG36_02914 [Bifiguratus adelaidae]
MSSDDLLQFDDLPDPLPSSDLESMVDIPTTSELASHADSWFDLTSDGIDTCLPGAQSLAPTQSTAYTQRVVKRGLTEDETDIRLAKKVKVKEEKVPCEPAAAPSLQATVFRSREWILDYLHQMVLEALEDFRSDGVLRLKTGRRGKAPLKRLTKKHEGSADNDTRVLRFPSRQSGRVLTVHLRVMELVYEAVLNGTFTTKRDIYYKDVGLFGSQTMVDQAIADLCSYLNVPRYCLNVTASSKGLIFGAIVFHKRNGTVIDCNGCPSLSAQVPDMDDIDTLEPIEAIDEQGQLIPMFEQTTKIEVTAQFVLVIEKEATFRHLLSINFTSQIEMPCILITGKGYPVVLSLSRRSMAEFSGYTDHMDTSQRQQNISEAKLKRLLQVNQRLKADLELTRVPVSEACNSLIAYCRNTRDPLLPSIWGPVEKSQDPFAPASTGGGCSGDQVGIQRVMRDMEALGGLDWYQKASQLGQSKQRGGDSSKWLIQSLKQLGLAQKVLEEDGTRRKLRLMDVGALYPDNYASYASFIDAVPMDLNPQSPEIIKQDLLELQPPDISSSTRDSCPSSSMSAQAIIKEIGKTGVKTPAIGLGCMGMSMAYGAPDQEESYRVLNRAIELGCTHWDTSNIYGNGHNEELLRPFLQKHREKIFLATKFGISLDRRGANGDPAYVRQCCEESLKRLGIDTIDLYYIHRIDPNTPIEKTVEAMAQLVKEGKVRFLGLSECSAQTLRRAHAVHPITAVQMEYSPWEVFIETNGVLEACRELGITVVAYSPLGRGFLTGAIKSPDDFAEDDFRRHVPRFQGENFKKNLELVRKLEALAKSKGCSAAELTLAWVIAQGPEFVAIPGTKRVKYLEQNCAANKVQLTPQDLQAIRDIIASIPSVGNRYPDVMMGNLGH